MVEPSMQSPESEAKPRARRAPSKPQQTREQPIAAPPTTRQARAAERVRRAQDAKKAELVKKALVLRRSGARYSVIAERLEVPESTIYRWVKDALAESVKEQADEVVALELERLDDMQVGIFADARRGDLFAVDRVLRIMERRAKYLSLDKDRTVQTHEVGSLLERLISTPPIPPREGDPVAQEAS